MHPPSNFSLGNPALVLPRAGASLVLLFLGCWGMLILARALPDVIGQIAHPCAECYLGPFSPPLEPYGHSLRPSEATGADTTASPGARLASTADVSWHWLAPRETIAADRFGFGLLLPDRTSAMLPASRDAFLPREGRATDSDPGFTLPAGWFQSGIAAEPTVWNTAPTWFSPTQGFLVAPVSGSDKSMADRSRGAWVIGASRPAEFGDGRERDAVQGSTPHWRVALRTDLERHFIQIGTYGANSDRSAGGHHAAGTATMISDIGADVGYHHIVNPGGGVSDALSVRAAVVHEARSLGVGQLPWGSGVFDSRATFLADASWTVGETVVPSLQYFHAARAADAIRYSWSDGRGNSAGIVAGVAYVPWSGDDSPMRILNLRFAARYVGHSDFGGPARGAGSGNALLLSLWGALRF